METENSIAESQYVFDEKALMLAKRFFNVEETSLLKVGNFGYQVALHSSAMRDGTFHRDMLHNEQFLISANLNSTLYNWAKTLDYPINLATPAILPVAFRVPTNDLEKLATGTEKNNIKSFVLPKDSKFDVGGFTFMMPYDLQVLFFRSANNSLSITASFDFKEINYPDPTISEPYLKVHNSNEGGVDYVTIAFNVFQLDKTETIITMASNNSLDSGIFQVEFGGNMATFNAFYSDNQSSTSPYVPMEMIFNEINKPTSELFAYYTFLGSDVLRVYFSMKPGEFRPAFNSKVKIETFTTRAEEGNFNFSGDIRVRNDVLDDIKYSVIPLASKSTGGSSNQSFVDTKIALIDKLKTRDSYTTTYDLETFFKNIKRQELTTNSEFKVVKIRDDIFRRQFSLYILQRNTSNEVIPTNTVDLEFSIDEISKMGYALKPGSLIIYDRNLGKYRLLTEHEHPEMYLTSKDMYLYSIPFLINFDFKEFPKTNVYMTNYDKSIPLTYSSYNVENPFEVVINAINVRRNPLFDTEGFYVSCNLNSSAVELNNLIVRSILFTKNRPVAYFDLVREGSTSEFKQLIKTTDDFDKDGYYIINDSFRDIKTNEIIANFQLDGSYDIKLGVFIKDKNSADEKPSLYGSMSDLLDYSLICELDSKEPIAFAEDLSSIMYCQLIVDQTTGRVRVSKVPMISALFYLNQYQNKEIMNDLLQNIQMAKDVSNRLENNTSVDIKYYNTYGISKYFDVDTIDININLGVALNGKPTRKFEETLKAFIVDFIEKCNDYTDTRFSTSNLIKALENKFSDIRYILLRSINGSNIQNVEQLLFKDTATENLPVDYVPEYLTVHKSMSLNNEESDYAYSINIEYL